MQEWPVFCVVGLAPGVEEGLEGEVVCVGMLVGGGARRKGGLLLIVLGEDLGG